MLSLADIFKEFPAFFNSITQTVVANGPIALAILLLTVLLGGVYLFRDKLFQSRGSQIGFSGLALVLGGLLIYLVFQSVQRYLNDTERGTMVVIKGTIRYPFPGKSAGDLDFELVGPNTTRNLGDSDDHFYWYDKGLGEKRVIVIAKPERVEMTVSNRRLYRQCTEDEAKLGSYSKVNQTIYTINLPKDAYGNPDGGTGGAVIYNLDFEYLPTAKGDILRLSGLRGIDGAKISYSARHYPDICLDEDSQAKYVEVIASAHALKSAPLQASAADIIHILGEALIAKSRAQYKPKGPDKNVIDLLGTSDRTLSGKVQNAIANAPMEYASTVAAVLHSTGARAVPSQINALVALKGASSGARLSSQSIDDVMRLSYSPSAELRQAARNYLVDPAVLDDGVVKTCEKHYLKEKDALKQQDPERFLLLALSMREIYYAAGINRLIDYVGNWGQRPLVPGAIDTSLNYFDRGIALIKDIPEANAVPYAKPYYGKALALRSRIAVAAALKKLGASASSKEVDSEIYDLVKQTAPLPFDAAQKAQFMETVDKFLAMTAGHEDDYLWPDHIRKLNACHEHQTYDCLRG
jgi:hypothetical protein